MTGGLHRCRAACRVKERRRDGAGFAPVLLLVKSIGEEQARKHEIDPDTMTQHESMQQRDSHKKRTAIAVLLASRLALTKIRKDNQEDSKRAMLQFQRGSPFYSRHIGSASKSVKVESLVFPCPKCGHRNRPAAQKLKSVKLYLLDKLPPCRKCGCELKSRNYDQSKFPDRLIKRASKELVEDGLLDSNAVL